MNLPCPDLERVCWPGPGRVLPCCPFQVRPTTDRAQSVLCQSQGPALERDYEYAGSTEVLRRNDHYEPLRCSWWTGRRERRRCQMRGLSPSERRAAAKESREITISGTERDRKALQDPGRLLARGRNHIQALFTHAMVRGASLRPAKPSHDAKRGRQTSRSVVHTRTPGDPIATRYSYSLVRLVRPTALIDVRVYAGFRHGRVKGKSLRFTEVHVMPCGLSRETGIAYCLPGQQMMHSSFACCRVGRAACPAFLLPSFLSSLSRCMARRFPDAANRAEPYGRCQPRALYVLSMGGRRRCLPAARRYHILASSRSAFTPMPISE